LAIPTTSLTGSTTLHRHTLSLHDALPIFERRRDRTQVVQAHGLSQLGEPCVTQPLREPDERRAMDADRRREFRGGAEPPEFRVRSEEHTSELQSRENLVCRLLLVKKKVTT